MIICLPGHLSPFCLWKGENALEGSRTTALCDMYACGCGARLPCIPGCVHVMLVQKVSWCMQRLHLQVILLLCLESAILLPLNYIRATGAHKPRQNGEPRQPRHLDTSTASTPTSTPRHHPHMESAFTNLDRPRHKPRHRLDRGSTASTPRQPGLWFSTEFAVGVMVLPV